MARRKRGARAGPDRRLREPEPERRLREPEPERRLREPEPERRLREPEPERAGPSAAGPTGLGSAGSSELRGSRDRSADGLTGFLMHLYPRAVRRRSGEVAATLGLGVATAAALGVATLTGVLLMFHYVPSIERAHSSVQDIVAIVPFGRFLRNLHRWSAHAAVLLCGLHLLRVLFWGSYRGAHRRVWLLGVGLLLLTAATSYSGYLLPWDQEAFWTVTVGTSLAAYVPLAGAWLESLLVGGHEIGQPALTRFFVLHVAALPALGAALLVLHLFRLRRAGGLARPEEPRGSAEELLAASPWLTGRSLAVALGVTLGLVLLAAGLDAPLGPAPDPSLPDNPAKAPWFVIGVQEMVSYSAILGGFLLPAALLSLLAALPWLDGATENDARFFPGAAARAWLAAAILLPLAAGGAALQQIAALDERLFLFANPASVSFITALSVALATYLRRRDRSLAARALVTGLLAAMALLTAIGWFGRGPDWLLSWHPGPGRSHLAATVTGRGHPEAPGGTKTEPRSSAGETP